MPKLLVYGLLAVLLVAVAAVGYKKLYPYAVPSYDIPLLFEVLNRDRERPHLVFIGDSHIANIAWGHEHCEVIPLAEGGRVTGKMRESIVPAKKLRPDMVVLLGGVNDVNTGVPTGETLDNLLAIYKNFRDIAVYLVFPASHERKLNVGIDKINALLVEKLHGNVKSINRALLKDGELNPDYTEDGLHLNEKGYGIWFKDLDAVLSRYCR